LNVAVVAAAATVTDVGTVSTALFLVIVTTAPPEGAVLEIVTVQELDAFEVRLAGLHATEDTLIEPPERLTVVVTEPFRAAVIVAVWSVVNAVPAEAVKVPVVAPVEITIPVGRVKFGLLPVSATTLQPDDALFRVTVQELEPPGDRLAGVHPTETGAIELTRLMVKLAAPLLSVAVRVAD
jgi:hypothetical protein